MTWFLWVLVIYYVLNLAILPTEVNKTRVITIGMAAFQALIWVGIIIGLLVMLL
jgi:hypothetical protein